MKKTVCELFAGVGGFRCGLNHIKKNADIKNEKWKTVWFNQWEPADKKTQWAHGCYVKHFGTCNDTNGNDTTNTDIHLVDKETIPSFNLLVGGFPCLTGDTIIETKRGKVEIKNILVNDEVLSHDGEYHKVIGYYDRGIKETYRIQGEEFEVVATENHKFYVKIKGSLPGWIAVSEIMKHKPQDVFFSKLDQKGNRWIAITKIAQNGKDHVYDITVEDTHSFIANGVITHNCQDYSVASSLQTSQGIEGKKGVLWWDIRDTLEAKKPPFVLLENVDRLLKSPAKQRGRDFAIILACFRDLGYTVEWRIINAADYGFQQRRRRIFIFAYRDDTKYAQHFAEKEEAKYLDNRLNVLANGFFAKMFPAELQGGESAKLPKEIGRISERFQFDFEAAGIMRKGNIHTAKVIPIYNGPRIVIGDILEKESVDNTLFIPQGKLYYSQHNITHCDETVARLPEEWRRTWQYIKGAKRYWRKASNGHEYIYSEGCMPMIDEWDKPARTLLTSEGSFGRSTHLVHDKQTKEIRLLTPKECERIQGFPDDWTKECKTESKVLEITDKKRKFMMGNALVVNLIAKMEKELAQIIENE